MSRFPNGISEAGAPCVPKARQPFPAPPSHLATNAVPLQRLQPPTCEHAYVCVCLCVCVRACVRACLHVAAVPVLRIIPVLRMIFKAAAPSSS